jgi:hypothetical protein
MIEPTQIGRPMSFRLRGAAAKTNYALDELIDRVKAGGRSDVELRSAGDVIQGSWEAALDLIQHAGLSVWRDETSASRVSGNARGEYGHRHRSAA